LVWKLKRRVIRDKRLEMYGFSNGYASSRASEPGMFDDLIPPTLTAPLNPWASASRHDPSIARTAQDIVIYRCPCRPHVACHLGDQNRLHDEIAAAGGSVCAIFAVAVQHRLVIRGQCIIDRYVLPTRRRVYDLVDDLFEPVALTRLRWQHHDLPQAQQSPRSARSATALTN
jgi:hypothetical protein